MAIHHYSMNIEVAGLVHIGNGSQYGKKDYYANGRKIVVLDTRKFVSMLDEQQVSRYCQFLQDNGRGQHSNANICSDLQTFLDRNPDMRKIAENSIAYEMESSLVTARRGAIQYYDVWEFVKDAYGNPYVPGSSVKGMLRTAILFNAVRADDSMRKLLGDDARNLFRDCKNLNDSSLTEKAFFKEHPDKANFKISNDIMKYISVTDSEPIAGDCLVLAKKFDVFSRNDTADHKAKFRNLVQYDGNSLNVYRECLRPGTKFCIDVDIDSRINSFLEECVLDEQGILDVLQKFFEFYSDNFLRKFSQHRWFEREDPYAIRRSEKTNLTTCYLGGGVDFASKTVVSALFDSVDERVRAASNVLFTQFPTKLDTHYYGWLWNKSYNAGFRPKKMRAVRGYGGRLKKAKEDHRHWMDPDLGVSPHTMKYGMVGDNSYPMGKCRVSISERK